METLDAELTGEILDIIKQLAAENKTLVIVTHEMNFARNVANHIIFMADGHILEERSPDEVFSSNKPIMKEFLGNLYD